MGLNQWRALWKVGSTLTYLRHLWTRSLFYASDLSNQYCGLLVLQSKPLSGKRNLKTIVLICTHLTTVALWLALANNASGDVIEASELKSVNLYSYCR